MISYDVADDTFHLSIVADPRETYVYYLDNSLALLCDIKSNEIVGFQLENFSKEFLQTHAQFGAASPTQSSPDLVSTIIEQKVDLVREVSSYAATLIQAASIPAQFPDSLCNATLKEQHIAYR